MWFFRHNRTNPRIGCLYRVRERDIDETNNTLLRLLSKFTQKNCNRQ